ncbi:MAG: WXG100 family type VII secretion target, partial [Actinomadura sp.]
MRRAADAWTEAGTDINELIGDLQATAAKVLGAVEGAGADAFQMYFEKFVATDPQYLPKLAQACEALGQALDSGATEIEYAKYMFIALLIITAIEIISLLAAAWATFGGSAAAIPAVEAGAQIASRTILQRLLSALGRGLVRKIVIGALRGMGEAVLLDLGIQALQIAQGNRDGFDLSKTGAAALDGAIGGAISGGIGHGMGKVPGLEEGAGNALSGLVRGAAREGISEAVSGVAGTVASAAIHGESLSGEDLAKGATSGAFGGAVGGGKSGLSDISTPHVDSPNFGGASNPASPSGGAPDGGSGAGSPGGGSGDGSGAGGSGGGSGDGSGGGSSTGGGSSGNGSSSGSHVSSGTSLAGASTATANAGPVGAAPHVGGSDG